MKKDENEYQDQENLDYLEDQVATSVDVGIIKIDYGNIWLDVIAGSFVLLFIGIGYYFKKKIDKKFK